MSASVYRFRTKADQIKTGQAAELRQMVKANPGLPEEAVVRIVAAIDSQTTAENGWPFAMMNPTNNAKVVSWLAANSSQPMVAMQLWATLFLHLQWDTGEVMQRRDELAEAVNVSADEVSRVMTELESIGAISRKRTKVPGMRGPGMVRYFMSPRIGTHLAGKARDNAQDAAPALRLVEAPSR
jgi:hypothetical protein